MADNKPEFPLNIVLRTVDKATAGLQKFNAKLDAKFKPFRDLNEQFGKATENLGLDRLKGAISGFGSKLKSIVFGFGAAATAAGAAGAVAFRSWIDAGDGLAKAADRIGVTIDELAQLRHAAAASGVEVEAFDGALETMNKGLGLAKAGTGKLAGFLSKVSPTLLKQVKSAKSTGEAFDLMAGAMVKLKDPAKKAAFATAIFGSAGQEMINFLNEGPGGIKKLREEYLRLAGPQEEQARNSEKVDDALGRVGAAFDGVKAAIITGLAPTVVDLADKFANFFAANREKIAAWIQDFGEKLPGRIDQLIGAITRIGNALSPIGDMITALGGPVNVLIGYFGLKLFGSVMSVVGAVTQVVSGLKEAGSLASALGSMGGGKVGAVGGFLGKAGLVAGAGAAGWGIGRVIADATGSDDGLSDWLLSVTGQDDARSDAPRVARGTIGSQQRAAEEAAARNAAGAAAAEALLRPQYLPGYAPTTFTPQGPQRAEIVVNFENMPKGVRVGAAPGSTAEVDISTGYQMGVP